MKTTKVWSIVRSIWNYMPATRIRLCRITSIVGMWLWKVRWRRPELLHSSCSFDLFRTPWILQENGRRRKWTCQQVHEISKQTWWNDRPLGRQGELIIAVSWLSMFFSFSLRSRNPCNKAGVRLSRLTRQHCNWKRMSIKRCLNYMASLANTSRKRLTSSTAFHRLFLVILTLRIIWNQNSLMNR